MRKCKGCKFRKRAIINKCVHPSTWGMTVTKEMDDTDAGNDCPLNKVKNK